MEIRDELIKSFILAFFGLIAGAVFYFFIAPVRNEMEMVSKYDTSFQAALDYYQVVSDSRQVEGDRSVLNVQITSNLKGDFQFLLRKFKISLESISIVSGKSPEQRDLVKAITILNYSLKTLDKILEYKDIERNTMVKPTLIKLSKDFEKHMKSMEGTKSFRKTQCAMKEGVKQIWYCK